MSNYRDDVNEIAVARDQALAKIRTLAESTARMRDVLLLGLGLLTIEAAHAQDQVIDRMHTGITEWAVGSDQLLGSVKKRQLVLERGKAADRIIGRTRTMLVESAHAADIIVSRTGQLVLERGRGADAIVGQRHSQQLVAEAGKARDVLLGVNRLLVLETGHGSDTVLAKAHARTLLQETAAVRAVVVDVAVGRAALVLERGRVSDLVLGKLHARDLVQELQAVGADELVSLGALVGQAWTAHADGWAMSRYAPFGFHGLAVIGGVPYATGPDGVYALDGTAETMNASLQTGHVDMTGGTLANLVESHLEYELAGTATMAVTATQSGGMPKTYAYPLKARPQATVLTNARFEFGRGLAGRHFAYTLNLTGQRAYINDWKVLAAPSKRSI